MTEPMTDAELNALRAAMDSWSSHYDPAVVVVPPAISMDALLARLDAERSRADAAEAARDAALARAMPEPVYVASAAVAEALPDGNYAYCFGTGRRLRGLATKRNRIWTFIGTDDECEPNSAEMTDTWVSGPLPDLPTPTAAQEAANG